MLGFVGFAALAGLLVTIGVTPALAVGSVTASSSVGIFQSLPDYISIGQLQQRNTLYATSGGKQVPFATLYDQNRVNLTWDQVSPNLKKAAVDGEDRRFYEHGGVDLTSLVRAAFGTISGGSLGAGGGGSTLTMQLVKNIRLAQAQNAPTLAQQKSLAAEATDTSISRKLQEMKLAIGLEKKYTKDQILLAYLNIAYFGDQAYGVEAAAEHYYNTTAQNLTPVQAASLIAIVQYPTSRNLATPKNYPANEARRNVILKSMNQLGDLSTPDYTAAVASNPASYVKLSPPRQGCAAIAAQYNGAQNFCDYVQRNVQNYSFLGANKTQREANWKTGGYKIYTTLNLDLNNNAKAQIDSYAPNTETRFDLGGVVDSIQPGTGRVIVMAQNKNYTAGSGNSTQTSLNYSTDEAYGNSGGFQTGSTYKAFTLADWLAKGHGLDEEVDATPRTFDTSTACGKQVGPTYTPKNDEGYIRGYMSVETATALSVNVAFVAMAQQLDLCDIRSTAESLGVHRADGAQLEDNPSSVLGTNYVAPLTMGAAYAAIADNGMYCSPIVVDKAVGPDGKDLGGQPKSCKQAISPEVAQGVVYAMKGTLTGGGTAVGADPGNGGQMFAKTGTTDKADQIWLIGSTTALTTVTWMGNVEGQTSLRLMYGPHGQYASSRASLFYNVQNANNGVYPGGTFTDPPQSEISGSGVTVPSLTGLTSDQAESALINAGLGYSIAGTQASALPQGQVTASDPVAGTSVAKGQRITFYTSDGSLATTVPTVTGQPLKTAISAFQNAGFDTSKVTVTYTKTDDSQKCDVQSSNPAGGSSAAKTAAIALSVGGGTDGKDPGNCS
ncbi:hypothetical protein AX769_18535 [Frondihabitans sp. PAMC 28766]|nr:hypothetical protein AX769_18535 [Frondihabitans sp. PAMC 28766]